MDGPVIIRAGLSCANVSQSYSQSIKSVLHLSKLDIEDFEPTARALALAIVDSQRHLQKLSYYLSPEGFLQDLISYTWTLVPLHKLRVRNPDLTHL